MRAKPILIPLAEYYRRMFQSFDLNTLPNRYREALPDTYWKNIDGVNNRILALSELAMEEFREEIGAVFDMVDLENAYGETLNLYGRMLEQPRGQLNDRQYRAVIRAQIACNLSKGDFTSVLAAIRMMLACGQDQVRMTELPDANCAVKVDTIPYTVLVNTGLTTRQVMKLIKRLIPAGVRLEELLFEGTFEFGPDALEYDEKKGFADLGQTIGGYFGAAVGDDENAVPLPVDL